MTIFYNGETNSFYDNKVNKTIPKDAVEISALIYKNLLEDQSNGMQIYTLDGEPATKEMPDTRDPLKERKEKRIDLKIRIDAGNSLGEDMTAEEDELSLL